MTITMQFTPEELRHIRFCVTNDLEVLDNGDFEDEDDREQSRMADRLIDRIDAKLEALHA